MNSVNSDDAGDAQSNPNNKTSTSQMEQEKDIFRYDILIKRLDEALPNPLHRRLLSAYTIDIDSALESMKNELTCIILEVLGRAD